MYFCLGVNKVLVLVLVLVLVVGRVNASKFKMSSTSGTFVVFPSHGGFPRFVMRRALSHKF